MIAASVLALLLAGASPPVRQLPFAITPNDYPAEARRRGLQGDSGYRLDISADGRVTVCTIVASAGSAILDDAACKVMQRARFQPARDDAGRPVAGTFSGWVPWVLWEGEPPRASGYAITVAVNSTGGADSCRVRRIVPTAMLSENDLRRCETEGDAQQLAAYLGQPLAGLQIVAIRRYSVVDPKERFDSGFDVRREVMVVEFDQARTGEVTRCAVLVSPGPGGADPCASGAFRVTAPGKPKARTQHYVVDAVATVAR